MGINPNKIFKSKCHTKMMTEDQRVIIERQCKEHNISLIRLTIRTFGYRKKTSYLTYTDAARCIRMASVWENYRRVGDEP